MRDSRAEPESAHLCWIKHPFGNRVDDPARPDVVTRQNALEFRRNVSTALEADRAKVGAIGNAEVVERTQQSLVEGLPKPHVACDSVLKPMHDVLAVGPLGGGSQPQEDLGAEPFEQSAVGRRFRMVELIDDHDVPRFGIDRFHRPRERLN